LNIELRELSLSDGKDMYDMIVEIGPGENGFGKHGYEMSFEDFPKYLQQNIDNSKSIGLKPGYVPQTQYWLVVDNKPVGLVHLRHHLNETLKEHGGHIGYTIRPSERGKGYGNIILAEILKEAKKKGISEALLTCNEVNLPSRKAIENNNGVLDGINQGRCKYWIKNL